MRQWYDAVAEVFTLPGRRVGHGALAVTPRGVGGQHCQPSNLQSHPAVSLSPASKNARCSHSRNAFSWANTRSVREPCTLRQHQGSRQADSINVTEARRSLVITKGCDHEPSKRS